MAARVGDASCARRRRERRQRSWWRHEQLSVAAALASAHTPQRWSWSGVAARGAAGGGGVQDTYDGQRAQNTPPPGLRPGVLLDPGPPWVEAVTIGYVAAGPPSLVVALVAEHDHVDQATVQFLLQ